MLALDFMLQVALVYNYIYVSSDWRKIFQDRIRAADSSVFHENDCKMRISLMTE